MNTLPKRTQLLCGAGAVLACTVVAIYGIEPSFVFVVPDSTFYMRMAQGGTGPVMQPFASRQLGALFVGAIAHLFHLTVEDAFLVETLFSFAVILSVVYGLMLQTAAPRWMLIAIALVPFWAGQMQYLVLPDMFYSALLALLLLLLAQRRMMLAALMMLPLMLARESTSLTLLCFLAAAWNSLRWRDRVVAALAAMVGAVTVAHLTQGSTGNAEQIPQALYILAKVPWNFLRNIAGVLPWSNVNSELCTVPSWSAPVHFHALQAVGVCGVSHVGQKFVVHAALTEFGLLPLMAAFFWWKQRHRGNRSPLLRFTLLYGTASFVLAPLLGNWVAHLAGYGWPLFFVALPMLMAESDRSVQTVYAGAGVLAMHLAVCAVSHLELVPGAWLQEVFAELGLWAVGLALLWYCWPLKKKTLG